jgi:ketosteroid isomerase-like protein
MLTFTFAAAAFGECSDADKKTFEAFDRAWGQAGESGNRDVLMTILADDYVNIQDGMQNKTQFIESTVAAAARAKANPHPDKVSHDNYVISCTPNSAVITHRNIIWTKNGAGGKEETFWTRSVHFLEKRGDKWQVVSNAGNGLDEYAALAYMEHDWNNAYRTRDIGWFERNLASDYSGVASLTAKLTNKTEDIAELKNDKSAIDWVGLSDLSVRVDGHTAVVTGVNHIKGKDENGKPVDRKLRFTDTFIKRDGRWQVWATQCTRLQ